MHDLAQPLHPRIPHSPNHPGFRFALIRRHGDSVREDGGSAANELLVTGGHVGTHVDALAHVSHDGFLHGGVDAAEAQGAGGFARHGIDEMEPVVARGVLLDVCAVHGVERLDAGHPVTRSELAAAASQAGVEPGPGDVALVRTGWAQLWDDAEAFLSVAGGVPGPTEDAAAWLVERGVRLTGSDTTAYEHIPAGRGHAVLPVHRLLLVEHGVHIAEMLDLEGIAAAGLSRVHVRARPAADPRRDGLARPAAGGGERVSEPTVVQRLGAWAAAARDDGLPAALEERAERHVRDLVGIMLAAVGGLARRSGDRGGGGRGAGPGQAAIPGRGGRAPAAQAALVGGTLAHALDFDDTHLPSVLHPSASVVPAALAAGEAAGAGGRAFLAAVAVGDELVCRAGMAGYDEALGQLDLLRARPARDGDLRRARRRCRGRAAVRPRRSTASRTRSRSPPRSAPACWRPTAPAARSSARTAAGRRTRASRRPSWPARG